MHIVCYMLHVFVIGTCRKRSSLANSSLLANSSHIHVYIWYVVYCMCVQRALRSRTRFLVPCTYINLVCCVVHVHVLRTCKQRHPLANSSSGAIYIYIYIYIVCYILHVYVIVTCREKFSLANSYSHVRIHVGIHMYVYM